MAAVETVSETNKITRKSSLGALLKVAFVSIVAVTVFRYYMDQKLAVDLIKYSSMEEASKLMTDFLNKTPPANRVALATSYLNNESPGMRYAAVDALDTQKGAQIPDLLEHAYLDSATEVRKRVLDIMPQFDVQRAYRLQLAALQDEDSWIRDHAVTMMSSEIHDYSTFVDTRAVPILMLSVSDSDPDVAPLAMAVLRRLTPNKGPEWRYSVLDPPAVQQRVKDRWERWWAAKRATWTANDLANVQPILPTRADPAPDFTIRDIDGKQSSLADFRGKVLLLNFWGTWCPPCNTEMPALEKLDNDYRGKGLVILGIAVKEKSDDSLRDWCRDHGVGYRQVLDSDTIAHVYGDCFEVPVSVLIDKKGMIRRRYEGERDYDTFRLAVERLLKE